MTDEEMAGLTDEDLDAMTDEADERHAETGGGDHEKLIQALPVLLRAVVEPVATAPIGERIGRARTLGLSDAWRSAPAAQRGLCAWLVETAADPKSDKGWSTLPGVATGIRAVLGRLGPDGRWQDSAGVEPAPAAAFDTELLTLPESPPARRWLVDGLVPAGRLSAFYGEGAAGKSRLVLQIAAAVVAGGGPVIARDPEAIPSDLLELRDVPEVRASGGRVMLVTWEDEPDEIARRWSFAHNADAITGPHPGDRVRILNMRAIGGALWAPHARGSRHTSTAGEWTEAGRRVLASIGDFVLVVIDPVAAAYSCSEVDRALVRAFCTALDDAAEKSGCTVLLVGHPPKSDSKYAGSTDWRNAVRGLLTLGPEETIYRPQSAGKKAQKIRAPRLGVDKTSYGPVRPGIWLRSEWQPASEEHPACLAWFATTQERAAQAAAVADVERARDDDDGPAGTPTRRGKGKTANDGPTDAQRSAGID